MKILKLGIVCMEKEDEKMVVISNELEIIDGKERKRKGDEKELRKSIEEKKIYIIGRIKVKRF